MNRLTAISSVLTLVVSGVLAQDLPVQRKVISSKVMGRVVKGAPYSADEITESLQVLTDGTRISNQRQVTVYRDGEGRVRRESPNEITIFDPVANLSYTLDPKTMTGVRSPLGQNLTVKLSEPSKQFFFVTADGVTPNPTVESKAAVEAQTQAMAASLNKLKAELAASQSDTVMVNGVASSGDTARIVKDQLALATEKLSAAGAAAPVKTEALGQQVMQGLTADGTRTTTTIEVGAIGNDRPILMVTERWYSAELQTPVMTKRNDPRSGEETFRLVNVRRGEPGADLFMLPPGYQLAPQSSQFAPRKEE